MHWKLKARIQSVVALLPNHLSYPLYYQLQRQFGGMRSHRIDPKSRMQVGIDACQRIVAAGGSPCGATFFEVGTGWRLNLPLACWLLGAQKVITVDLNRYLRTELVREDLVYVRSHRDAIAALFEEGLPDYFDRQRFDKLLRLDVSDAKSFCRAIGVEYMAPADAADTKLPSGCVDYHVSCNVLEHIPRAVLLDILIEANRVVRPTGLLVHQVDHSDHFAHNDPSISRVNFLRYTDRQWDSWANNRYAYVNRLREDDYVQLFEQAEQAIHVADSNVDTEVADVLKDGMRLDDRFGNKSVDILSRLDTLFVTSPAKAGARAAA